MIDETFHLTPLDVRRFEFGRSMRGYDPARVEEFRQQVADELERLTRINQDLESKTKGFNEQLRAFKERDKALNDALISAQQLRAEIREQAEREAQLILREARAEAERMQETMKGELRDLRDQLTGLERARRGYLAQLRVLVERQLAEIEAAETALARPPIGSPDTEGEQTAPRISQPTPSWLDSLMKE
ncbi:MAG: DivIVA domain-containing protein [Gemmatimonadaceae bacterium]|nr:DivIVA domain-containing protein [Gemmatimonadaceae bacterium]